MSKRCGCTQYNAERTQYSNETLNCRRQKEFSNKVLLKFIIISNFQVVRRTFIRYEVPTYYFTNRVYGSLLLGEERQAHLLLALERATQLEVGVGGGRGERDRAAGKPDARDARAEDGDGEADHRGVRGLG